MRELPRELHPPFQSPLASPPLEVEHQKLRGANEDAASASMHGAGMHSLAGESGSSTCVHENTCTDFGQRPSTPNRQPHCLMRSPQLSPSCTRLLLPTATASPGGGLHHVFRDERDDVVAERTAILLGLGFRQFKEVFGTAECCVFAHVRGGETTGEKGFFAAALPTRSTLRIVQLLCNAIARLHADF